MRWPWRNNWKGEVEETVEKKKESGGVKISTHQMDEFEVLSHVPLLLSGAVVDLALGHGLAEDAANGQGDDDEDQQAAAEQRSLRGGMHFSNKLGSPHGGSFYTLCYV